MVACSGGWGRVGGGFKPDTRDHQMRTFASLMPGLAIGSRLLLALNTLLSPWSSNPIALVLVVLYIVWYWCAVYSSLADSCAPQHWYSNHPAFPFRTVHTEMRYLVQWYSVTWYVLHIQLLYYSTYSTWYIWYIWYQGYMMRMVPMVHRTMVLMAHSAMVCMVRMVRWYVWYVWYAWYV